MTLRARTTLVFAICLASFGCGSDSNGGSNTSAGAGGAAGSNAVAGPPAGGNTPPAITPTAGTQATGNTTPPAVGGSSGAAGMAPTGGSAAGGGSGAGGSAGSSGSGGSGGSSVVDAGMPDAGDDPGMMMGNGSSLTGTLGALGAVKPVVAGWATTNGLETLIYLSSSKLSCADMMTMGTPWLRALPAGTQVIEIVVRGNATVGMTSVGFLQGEINYAEGSKSSSNEVVASSGSITFTKAEAKKVFEGMITATYPMGMLMGTFHADWCEGGAEY